MLIGLDFDNTLARYDKAFSVAARDMGLGIGDGDRTKEEIKKLAKRSAGGEEAWQRLQGRVYGYYMARAELFPGVAAFVRRVREAGNGLVIVSHKSEYGHFDQDRINLRTAALAWMRTHEFFGDAGLGFLEEDIHFASTREDKLAMIGRCGCGLFVDDLPEVLLDAAFPAATRRLLFAPNGDAEGTGLPHFISWDALAETLVP
ncbi:MAG: hypothetical protein HQL37_01280 [Alphaproteobacteria bacterium]|nr:hypothetical protein [Alphaproteobacteria bacterium]